MYKKNTKNEIILKQLSSTKEITTALTLEDEIQNGTYGVGHFNLYGMI